MQAFWSSDGERIGYLGDPRPEAGLIEQPQAWSMRASGGRATKLAGLQGEISGAAFSPSGKLAYVGLDDPSFSGSTNLGLWVREGRRTRRLGEELDRTFFFIVVGDLLDFGALAPVPVIWLDDESVVTPVTDRGSCVPYRFGLDGSVERLVERDDAACTWLAAGGGRLVTVASVDGGACDVYAEEDGDLRRLSRNGGSWFGPYRRDPERHAIRHRDGHEVDAWVVRPRAPACTGFESRGGVAWPRPES